MQYQVEKIWADFDVDNNGILDKKELRAFCNAFLAHHGPPGMADSVDGQFEMMFKKFDTNDNGTIEKAELRTFLELVQ